MNLQQFLFVVEGHRVHAYFLRITNVRRLFARIGIDDTIGWKITTESVPVDPNAEGQNVPETPRSMTFLISPYRNSKGIVQMHSEIHGKDALCWRNQNQLPDRPVV